MLGLGDRHPSNILIDQFSGRVRFPPSQCWLKHVLREPSTHTFSHTHVGAGGIVHIDFADCFEAAQQREKYIERVPFRLTRILVNAMEVCFVCACVCVCM